MSGEVMNLWQKKTTKMKLVLGGANNTNIPYLQKFGSVWHAKQRIKLVWPYHFSKKVLQLNTFHIR